MSNLIALKSSEGQQLLDEVRNGNGLFQPVLHSLFKKQIGNQNCGVQSCAMIMGARDIGIRLGTISQSDPVHEKNLATIYHEIALLNMPETKLVGTEETIQTCDGLSLVEVQKLLRAHQLQTSIHLASDRTEDEFRQHAKEALKQTNSSSGVIVNYHMDVLGQSLPFGHHSPLGGYHEETDKFILLDVWHATDECWAKTTDLHRAMNTIDDSTGKTRGYIIVN